jgi:nitric oxide reductase subunit C
MKKLFVISILLITYAAYSGWVYSSGTNSGIAMTSEAIKGKHLWQTNNCQNCHQIFGLGGYMGPELTTVTADKNRGTLYAKAFILNGGNKMPNFHFNEAEATALIAWLTYVNTVAEKNNPEK